METENTTAVVISVD